MTNLNFSIQDKKFLHSYNETNTSFDIESIPRKYSINIISNSSFNWIIDELEKCSHPLVLIDKKVKNTVLKDIKFNDIPVFDIEAIEDNKGIDTVLQVCDFLIKHKANRGSMLFVIGGGIVQDIGAFSAAMVKRGIPWSFIPTTLLSQADSCLGGKTAVNFNASKNTLGLFSAPRFVYIDTNFLKSLSAEDLYSGSGEILRLMITGGYESFKILELHKECFSRLDNETIKLLIHHSLNIKKSIVEYDEFEIDIRRSMNYGHSIGHALEAASHYGIPHGQAVTVGILVENQIAVNRGMLSKDESGKIKEIALLLLSNRTKTFLSMFDADLLLEFLFNDKKAVGTVLKLATLESIGQMKFIDLNLDYTGQVEVTQAFNELFK